MSAETRRDLATEHVARLAETLAEAWALYNRLLNVGFVIGCDMFIGRAAASGAVAGGFDLALSSAAKAVCLLSHAERVHDSATAVEEAVLATCGPLTPKDLAVVYSRAAVLAGTCYAACEMLEREGLE